MFLSRANDGFAPSTDREALSMDLSASQHSVDRASPSENAHAIVASVVCANG